VAVHPQASVIAVEVRGCNVAAADGIDQVQDSALIDLPPSAQLIGISQPYVLPLVMGEIEVVSANRIR
jgi:hypothetical protein